MLFNVLALITVYRVTALSKFVQHDLLKKTVGLKKKTEVIYWGVDTEKFFPRPRDERINLRKKLELPVSSKIIGFIGRYDLWKGHETFLHAAHRMLTSSDELLFLIVGGAMTEHVIPEVARYRASVENMIQRLELGERLRVWGHRDNIPEIMSCLDVLVCPSDYEPFGLIVLEALASGVPVVVSSSVAALEVVGDNGNVVVAVPKSPESFSEKISEVLSRVAVTTEPQLPKTVQWSECAKQYEEIYYNAMRRAA